MTTDPSFAAASLEPLAHCQNVDNESLFYRYYLGIVNLNWLNFFHVLILEGGLLIILMV